MTWVQHQRQFRSQHRPWAPQLRFRCRPLRHRLLRQWHFLLLRLRHLFKVSLWYGHNVVEKWKNYQLQHHLLSKSG